MQKTYPIHTVKRACDTVFLRPINPRTFRNWKRKLGLKPYAEKLTELEAIHLLNLSYLTRISKTKRVTLGDVINFTDKHQEVQQELKQELSKAVTCLGSELPKIIFDRTGRRVSARTLYRYADKAQLAFGLAKVYTQSEIKRWCDTLIA